MNFIYLNNKFHDISNLPAVPCLLVELLKLCHDDEADFESFARIIEQDPGLTTKILQIANSSAFRQWNNIDDLRRMLIVLGLGNVRTIVAAAAVEQFFSQFGDTLNHQIQLVWVRSVVCANLCERIARLLGHHRSGEAFMAGLLHQVGILILLKNEEASYLPVLETYHDNPAGFCRREMELLQIDHCQMGAALIEHWKLDSFLADAIQFQQAPTEELVSAPTLLKILAVAGVFNCGKQDNHISSQLSRAARLLGLTAETINSCIDDAISKSATMFTALGLDNAFATINQYHTTGTMPRDETSSEKLRHAVRQIALRQTTATGSFEELHSFTRQIRITFSSVFPLRQLLFLIPDRSRSRLVPVNDLALQQLTELSWPTDDTGSLVVKALTTHCEQILTTENSSITDRQLLRLLDNDAACILPLTHKQSAIALIALSFDRHNATLNAQNTALMKLFCKDITSRYASFCTALNDSFKMGAAEFKRLVHEVSNPLAIINNYLYTLSKKLGEDNPAQLELRSISDEIDRVGRILLHAQTPQQSHEEFLGYVNVNRLITDLDRLLRDSLYKTNQIKSVLQLDDKIPDILCSADKLKQILINLTKNAVEALPAGGTIEIFTRDGIFQNQQRLIEITVRDNGPGIDPAILPLLFKPVTSTKRGHSGVGLSVVNSLINDLAASISCCSSPEKGTEFKILIPRKTAEIK